MQKIVSFLKKKREPTSWSNFDREDSDDKSKTLSRKGSLMTYNVNGYSSNGNNNGMSNRRKKGNSGNGNNSNNGGSNGMVHSPSNSSISSTSSSNSNTTNSNNSSNNLKIKSGGGGGSNNNKNNNKYQNNDDDCDSDDFIPGEVRSISKTIDFSKSERKWLISLNIPSELLDSNISVLLNVLNFLSKKEGILYIQTPINIYNNNIGKKQQIQLTSSQQLLQQQQQQLSNGNGSNYSSYVNSRSNSIVSNNSSITPSTSSSNLNNHHNQHHHNNDNNKDNSSNQNCTVPPDSSISNNGNNNGNGHMINMIGASTITSSQNNSSKNNLNSLLSSSNGGISSGSGSGNSNVDHQPTQPMRRSDYNRIFIEPGKFYMFPESESFALARLVVEEEDPSKLFRTGENAEVKGAFGTVYQVFYVNGQYNNIDVALKKMDHKSEKKRRNNLNEISILRYLKHPNIVTYINSYEKNDEEIWMVMEYMDGGTIKEAITNFSFTEKYVAYITKEILHSLEYLHSINIAHRDLKNSNIMINSKAEVKLIDFGFSIDLTHLKQDINMCGSPFYMSPEQIQDKAHGLAVDIWSLGIVVAEMVRGVVPHQKSKIKAMFLAGTVGVKFSKDKKYSCHWSPELFDFLEVCLQMDPSKRPTPTQLLQHPFIATAATKAETLDLLPLLFMSKTLSKLSRKDNL